MLKCNIIFCLILGKRKASTKNKDPALAKKRPDKTFYLAYDFNNVPTPRYHHERFYPYETMAMVDRDAKSPQFNQISLKVSKIFG